MAQTATKEKPKADAAKPARSALVKKKEIKSVKAADLGMGADTAGAAGARTKILKMSAPPQRQAGKIIPGETPEEKAPVLAKLLREEAKII